MLTKKELQESAWWHRQREQGWPEARAAAERAAEKQAQQVNTQMTDYHELPEVPRCCGTCTHVDGVLDTYRDSEMYCSHPANADCGHPQVVPHGLCSHWERRDDGG